MESADSSAAKPRVVIVTGSGGNLGQAIVKKFTGGGYYIIGTVTAGEQERNDDVKIEKVVVDLMNAEDTEKFVDAVVAKHTSIDVAILTVGGFALGKITETKTADIAQQYKLNFETTYNAARPVFLQMLKQNSGRIFMVGSKPGLNAKNSKGTIAYGLSKSLIFRLAELMNEEAKGKNVVTTVVVPGTIDTPVNRKAMPEADYNSWVKAEAIADIIFWHCSNSANVIREPILKVYNNS